MENAREILQNELTAQTAICIVLSALGLTPDSLSTYKEYSLPNGEYIRLRISNHGLFLQNWFNANKKARAKDSFTPKLNTGYNLSITFAPTEQESKEAQRTFPMKIKNVTKAKTINGKNVKPQFSVRHICYYTWKLDMADINKIAEALLAVTTKGGPYREPIKNKDKSIEWIDTSNLPPKRIMQL